MYDEVGRQSKYGVLRRFVLNTLGGQTGATDSHNNGVMFLYDITRQQSWEECKGLIDNGVLEAFLDLPLLTQEQVEGRLMIVGCWCDLTRERQVEYTTVKEYADRNGMLFLETSPQEGVNVEVAFVSLTAQVLDRRKY